jgi:hypothetical protein
MMGYGENANRVVSDYVDQIIRKASRNVFVLLALVWSTDFWGPQEKLSRPSNFCLDPFAQARYCMLVINRSPNQLQLRFRMEFKNHRFRRDRRCSKTRSPGIV